MKTYDFEGRTISLQAMTYENNGTLALMAFYDENGDDSDVLSVNLNNAMMQNDECCFIDTNNIPWAPRFLEKFNLAEPTGVSQRSGFCTYPLYKVNREKLAG